MTDGWPTNDELVSLHSELRDAVLSALRKQYDGWEDIAQVMFDVIQQQYLGEANYENIIANDPAAIDDLFADYEQLQSEIPEPPPNDGLFREITYELDSWTGDAASEFQIQLGDIHEFLGEQALYFEEMKGCLNGAYLLSVEARKSYRSLAEQTIRALETYVATEEESTALAVISVVAGVVLGALSAATVVGGIILGALAGGAAAAVNVIQQSVGGEDVSTIVGSYAEALNMLNRNLDEEGAELANAFQEAAERVVNQSTNISSPLPVVDSYEDFQSPFRPAGGEFDGRVQQELDPPASKQQKHSAIQQALG